ncbi:hypothetical protein [Amycolatopsis sp. NPDC054798]
MNPRLPFIAAPLLVLTYGIVRILDGLDGSRGPGPAWTAGHLAFLGALAMFVPVFLRMRRLAGRTRLASVATVAAITGAVALAMQFAIDLISGFQAADHAEMSMLTAQLRNFPGLTLFAYDAGPYLFYLGQLALVIQLAVGRKVKIWTPALVFVDMAMPFVDKDLIPLGSVLLLVSFVSIARTLPAGRPGAKPAPALV